MLAPQQRTPAVRQRDQLAAEQREGGDVERLDELRLAPPGELGLRRGVVELAQIRARDPDLERRVDALERAAALAVKARAQDLVPADDLGERALERGDRQGALEQHRERGVVRGGSGGELALEPHALLRVRQRVRTAALHRLRTGIEAWIEARTDTLARE